MSQALEYMNELYECWVVDIDLEKFFDIVNHDKLIQIVSEEVLDGDVVSLISKYLQSGIMLDEGYKETEIGTPQGGPLSPLLANIILDKLDKELESRNLRFVRYADDVQIYVKSERAASRVMKNVTRFLSESLKLKVNVTKSKIRRPDSKDTKFLGFGFYIDNSDYTYKAKPHLIAVKRLKAKVKTCTARNNGWSMDKRFKKLKSLFNGWFHYFKIGAIKTITKMIDGYTRNRLRICIWKQWKKISTKYRALIRLGINKAKAWEWANSRKGYARVANSFIMKRAVPNRLLVIKGFHSMETLYVSNSI